MMMDIVIWALKKKVSSAYKNNSKHFFLLFSDLVPSVVMLLLYLNFRLVA